MSWRRFGTTWKSPPGTLASHAWPRGILAVQCSDKVASNQKLSIRIWVWFLFPGGLIPELSPSQGHEATSAHGHAAACNQADSICAGPELAITQAKESMVPAPAALTSTAICPRSFSSQEEREGAGKPTRSFWAPGTVLLLLNPHI